MTPLPLPSSKVKPVDNSLYIPSKIPRFIAFKNQHKDDQYWIHYFSMSFLLT